MIPKAYRGHVLVGLNVAWALLLVLAFVSWDLISGGAPVEAVQPKDLTGETCTQSAVTRTVVVNGTTLTFTYCLMQGPLAPNTALEMDDIGNNEPSPGNAASVADANLFKGTTANDPDLPVVAGANYIDWNDLGISQLATNSSSQGTVENHAVRDWVKTDETIFRNPSCITSGSILPKEDITQFFLANNNAYLYTWHERRTNSGNSVYYYIFSKQPPILVQNGDCSDRTKGQLQFNLSTDDVEILVNFPSSSDPAGGAVFFRKFSSGNGPTGYIPAEVAVFHSGWGAPTSGPIKNFSLTIDDDTQSVFNASSVNDDNFGSMRSFDAQGNVVSSGQYDTAQGAEWAVDLNSFFSGQSLCGNLMFVTVFSRAATGQSESITENAALKDSAGPKLYNFGSALATASLTPTCTMNAAYSASGTDVSGQPIANATAAWNCTATDSVTGANRTGGLSFSNQFTTTGTITVTENAARTPAVIDCTVTITDTASSCSATATAQTTILAPIQVDLNAGATSLACAVPGGTGFSNTDVGTGADIAGGVTFQSVVSGGDGAYTYDWTVTGPNQATTTCADQLTSGNTNTISNTTCVVNPPVSNFCSRTTLNVTVNDGTNDQTLCNAVTSETEVVTKTTTINATNNP